MRLCGLISGSLHGGASCPTVDALPYNIDHMLRRSTFWTYNALISQRSDFGLEREAVVPFSLFE